MEIEVRENGDWSVVGCVCSGCVGSGCGKREETQPKCYFNTRLLDAKGHVNLLAGLEM
jgi:hypothetical protein